MLHPPRPHHCRLSAYEHLARQLDQLHSTQGLVEAATAIAMHAMEDADPAAVLERIDALVISVRQQARTTTQRGLVAHLHQVLFEQERFRGNTRDYYDPANSFLPRVLQSRLGIPVSLALIYKAVGERLGLAVHGVGAPGHFLVCVNDEGGPMLVDPFHGGRLLTEDEAYELMDSTLGTTVPRSQRLLERTDHHTWLDRMLRNLESIYTRRAQPSDSAAMREMRHLLSVGQ